MPFLFDPLESYTLSEDKNIDVAAVKILYLETKKEHAGSAERRDRSPAGDAAAAQQTSPTSKISLQMPVLLPRSALVNHSNFCSLVSLLEIRRASRGGAQRENRVQNNQSSLLILK